MPASSSQWADYKRDIVARVDDFSRFYTGLEGCKPSTDSWVTARCPFHEDGRPSFAFEKTTGNWKCHAGCGEGSVFDFVAKQNGGSFKDALLHVGDELGVPRPSSSPEKPTTYDYTDADGTMRYQVVRAPNKRFYQRRPNGKGGWIKNLRGVQRVLYRLPEITTRPDEVVYVVEGEKDADRLAGLGLLATTNSGGAGKWKPEYADIVTGRDIVIIPDNDNQGQRHALRVAGSLEGIAASVRIVQLPDLPDKGDVSDWLDAGGNLDALKELVAEVEPWSPEAIDPVPDNLPSIQTNGRQLRDVVDEAWEAVLAANDPPEVFAVAAGIGRLSDGPAGLTIQVLDEHATYGHLSRVADWVKVIASGVQDVDPKRAVAQEIVSTRRPGLPELEAVVTTPVFDCDWRLVTAPGYHQGAKVFYHRPKELEDLDVPLKPDEETVRAALALILDDLLVDFPFATDADRAHAVAALLLPFVRRMFDGPTPIHLIEAPTPGSGKTLLAELIAMIAVGGASGTTTLTRNEDESRKKLTALLARGPNVISIDNVDGGLWSAQFASAVTAPIWEDRILGKTQMVAFPNRALWMVSGNNPKLSMEIARRCVRIRLDSGDEQPWTRTGFKHDPIREWTKRNRPQLVRAVLILIQHWIASGAVFSEQTLGSFEEWSRHLGGILTRIGVPGFLAGTDEFYAEADSESSEWRAFVLAWWDMYQDRPVTGSALLQLATGEDHVTFAYAAKSEHAQRVRFGKSLASLRDRRFGDYRVVLARDAHKKTRLFRLERVGEVV